MTRSRFLPLIPGLLLALAAPVSAQYPYEVIDLGVLNDTISAAYRINNYGQVVVTTTTGASTNTALWQPITPNNKLGSLSPLGSLGGTVNYATSINEKGHVAGSSTDSGGVAHAFIWQPASDNTATGALHNAGVSGVLTGSTVGINNYGQLTGIASGNAFIWTPGTANGLTGAKTAPIPFPPSAYSGGYALNASGQMAGSAGGNSGTYHAIRFTPTAPNTGTGSYVAMDPIGGPITSNTSVGLDINDAGTVAGYYLNAGHYNPILWNGTTMTNLAPTALGGATSGVNNAGDAVGNVSFISNSNRAFLYNSGAGLVDLNTLIDPLSGWSLTGASDINDHGQIVGTGFHNGQQRAYLLAPAAAPEPGTLGLLALGMLSGIAARRKVLVSK